MNSTDRAYVRRWLRGDTSPTSAGNDVWIDGDSIMLRLSWVLTYRHGEVLARAHHREALNVAKYAYDVVHGTKLSLTAFNAMFTQWSSHETIVLITPLTLLAWRAERNTQAEQREAREALRTIRRTGAPGIRRA